MTTARANTRRIPDAQKETIEQVRSGFHRGQDFCHKESPSNRHQFIAQGPPRHKQNDSRRTTLLVATDD